MNEVQMTDSGNWQVSKIASNFDTLLKSLRRDRKEETYKQDS